MTGAIVSLAATGIAFAQTTPRAEGEQPAAASGAASTETPSDATRQGGETESRRTPMTSDAFQSRRMERLQAADADGNGELSLDEVEDMVLKQMVERRARRMVRRLDVDGDGTVTLSEIQNRRAKRFALMDRNDDGELDRREMRRGFHGRMDRGRDFRHHGRHGGERFHRGDHAGYMMMPGGRRDHFME